MGDFQKLRHAAAAEGQTKFFTGRPCHRGHISQRYVRNGACIECLRPARTESDNLEKIMMPVHVPLSLSQARQFDVLKLAKERFLGHWLASWLWAEKEWAERSKCMVRPGAAGKLVATDKCDGYTLDQMRESGWTDSQLVYNGYASIVPEGTDEPA